MFEDIIDIFYSRASLVRRRISFLDFNPKRDWSIVLVVSLVLMLGFIFFDAYTFIEINRGEKTTMSEDVRVATINRGLLEDVLEVYREKERNLEDLKGLAPAIVDPSF